MTREEWLNAATTLLREDFKPISPIPKKLRVTCGWPSTGGRPGKKQVIGQCFPPSCSEDETTEVFINPMLSDAIKVLDVLVHELVHAAVGCEEGHKGPFRVTAKAIGLTGKMTATVAGKVLMVRLRAIEEELGEYPHAKLTPITKKPQSTWMLKVTCDSCGYLLRTSRKWADLGAPTCVCGGTMSLSD